MIHNNTSGISIIIPTYNGGDTFRECLAMIASQKYPAAMETIIIDSGSTDGTIDAASDFGAHVLSIPRADFHHSRTRNHALMAASYPEVVLLVQDAIPVSNHWLQDMSNALHSADIVALSGMHLPHAQADLFARFEVDSHREYLGSAFQTFGFDALSGHNESYDTLLRKIRLDNVCSIYRTEVLRRSPFPDVPFGEDMAWAYALLRKGCRIAYDPRIAVYHSHNRSSDYRFSRAVIDSLAKATILSRVRDDLSHVSFNQYQDVHETILLSSARITDSFLASFNPIGWTNNITAFRRKMYIQQVMGRLLNKVSVLCSMSKNHSRSPWVKSFVSAYEHLMHKHLLLVMQRYNGFTADDLKSFISGVTYTILGNVLGEIYGSRLLMGVAADEFAPLVNLHMTGV
jgi:GT2 family glycosyltransferase